MDDTDTVKRLWRERGSTLITSIEAKEWGKSYRGDDSCTLWDSNAWRSAHQPSVRLVIPKFWVDTRCGYKDRGYFEFYGVPYHHFIALLHVKMDIKNLLCAIPCSTVNQPPIHPEISPCSHASSPSSLHGNLQSMPSLSSASLPLDSPTVVPEKSTLKFINHTRTPWSKQEDDLLRCGYKQGLSWAQISSTYLPHRSRGCCWGRFKTLQSKKRRQQGWNQNDDQMLLIAIRKHAALFSDAWKAVSREVPDRTSRECRIRYLKLQNC